MVISRLISHITLIGSLLGAFPAFSMGFRYGGFNLKGRLAAAALGGSLWGAHSMTEQQKRKIPSRFPTYTHDNHPYDLNPVGLVHSLPRKRPGIQSTSVTKVLKPAVTDVVEDTTAVDIAFFSLAPVMAGFETYGATKAYVDDYIEARAENGQQLEKNEEEVEQLAIQNGKRTAVKTMVTGSLSMALSKGIEVVSGVDTESIDEVGEFVATEVEKDSSGYYTDLPEKQKKERNMVSAAKLALKLGLVWLAYQGLKTLVTYATGYQCQCPQLPAEVVGSGRFSQFIRGCIEHTVRGAVKGLLASAIVMPLLSMAEQKAVPLVSETEIQKLIKAKRSAAVSA